MLIARRIFALVLIVAGLSALYGQNHEMVVPSWGQSGKYLNEIIGGDTLAGGVRVDTLRVYVLQRDSVYLCNTAIQNPNWTINMRAEYKAGERPTVFLFPNPSTSLPPGQFINAKGDVKLSNINISGFWEPGYYILGDSSYLGGLQGALINLTVSGYSYLIDSCIMTNINGNHLRTDAAPKNVKVTNTIFSNMGYLGRSNLGAGKAIDVRAGAVDSLIILNCTFVNAQDRIIRHYASTAAIKYFRFDHNTVVNSMSYHGILSLGKTSSKVEITNNLFVDAFALGNDTDYIRQAEFSDSQEKDFLGKPRMTWVISNPDDVTRFQINNNYYSVSDSGQAFYNTYASQGVTGEGSPLTWNINKKIADSVNAFKKITLKLTKTPSLMTNMMRWYRTPIAQGGAGKSKDTRNFDKTKWDFDRRTLEFFRDTMDCQYPTSAAAYTGGTGGYPVGDLNWFPTKKSQWEVWILTDVNDISNDKPQTFTLNQNYPNPFNPTTKISFNLAKAGMTRLVVYNVLGQVVAVPVSQQLNAGGHDFDFDASGLAAGVYVYRLESNNQTLARKMVVLK